jgi:predicted Fe-Mo cluster-binding NifX family protein
MKIVMPVTDESAERVSNHLGRAPYFAWYLLENKRIVDRGKVPNDGIHFGGARSPPERIQELGADVVVGYGMGAGALLSFKKRNIKVLEALSPSPIQNLAAFTIGKLEELTRACPLHHRQGITCK